MSSINRILLDINITHDHLRCAVRNQRAEGVRVVDDCGNRVPAGRGSGGDGQQWHNQIPAGGARVYLTNLSVTNPWPVVDAYDDRSWIENGLFRQNKQFGHLTRWFPQKSEAGVRSHLVFVMLIFAVATAYRLWDKQSTDPPVPPAHLPPD
jgi:hypothetical protein